MSAPRCCARGTVARRSRLPRTKLPSPEKLTGPTPRPAPCSREGLACTQLAATRHCLGRVCAAAPEHRADLHHPHLQRRAEGPEGGGPAQKVGHERAAPAPGAAASTPLARLPSPFPSPSGPMHNQQAPGGWLVCEALRRLLPPRCAAHALACARPPPLTRGPAPPGAAGPACPAAARARRTRCPPSAQEPAGAAALTERCVVAVRCLAVLPRGPAGALPAAGEQPPALHTSPAPSRTSPNICEISGEVMKSPAVPKTSRCV